MSLTTDVNDEKPWYILQSLADTLGVEVDQNLNECRIDIPESYGKGVVKLLTFTHGISIIILKFELTNDLDLVYNDGMVHPLKILLIKEGFIKHAFNKGEKLSAINSFESVLIASTPDNNHSFKIPRNKKVSFLSIQINRKLFEPKVEDFIPHMHKDLSKIFRDVNGIQEFYHKNFYTPESLKLIEDIFNGSGQDFIESIYVEGQTYQLMMSQLKSYLVNSKSIKPTNTIASKTRLKLSKAVELIENNIADYTTVKDLASTLGINVKTLQAAFKQFYNCTVNTYVRNFRAHHARMYVETTDLSVSEIAYKLGLNSPNHLSKLFKLYYGCSPSEHKRKTKNLNIK